MADGIAFMPSSRALPAAQTRVANVLLLFCGTICSESFPRGHRTHLPPTSVAGYAGASLFLTDHSRKPGTIGISVAE
jgi:hypothetical protein